jgi:hypothetical protein
MSCAPSIYARQKPVGEIDKILELVESVRSDVYTPGDVASRLHRHRVETVMNLYRLNAGSGMLKYDVDKDRVLVYDALRIAEENSDSEHAEYHFMS